MSNEVGTQLPLITLDPIKAVPSTGDINTDFITFHEANPSVFTALVQVALSAKDRGMKMGMKAVYEVVRWQSGVTTDGRPFKLNNNFTSLYSRFIMATIPELDGFFETRKRRGEEDGDL